MPRRVYSPDEKADALEILNHFGGDVAAASIKSGIPQRTLYTWRTEQWDQQRQQRQSQPPPPLKILPQYESAIEGYLQIRSSMFRLLDRIPLDLSHLPPYLQRDHHLARIAAVDIIAKLTHLLNRFPELEFDEVEYVHEYVTEEPQPKPATKITHTYINLPPPVVAPR